MKTWPLDEQGSIAWIADPSERMQRASVALAVEGGCLVCDPVDAGASTTLLAGIGRVLGVCRLLDGHGRDAAALGGASRRAAPRRRASSPRRRRSPGSSRACVYRARRWHETALWLPERRLLVVPESVGTIPFFLRAPGDRLGIHCSRGSSRRAPRSQGSSRTRSPSATARR